jgi:hypothetical protein
MLYAPASLSKKLAAFSFLARCSILQPSRSVPPRRPPSAHLPQREGRSPFHRVALSPLAFPSAGPLVAVH